MIITVQTNEWWVGEAPALIEADIEINGNEAKILDISYSRYDEFHPYEWSNPLLEEDLIATAILKANEVNK